MTSTDESGRTADLSAPPGTGGTGTATVTDTASDTMPATVTDTLPDTVPETAGSGDEQLPSETELRSQARLVSVVPPVGVPATLVGWAGTTWRILVVLAGLSVVGYLLGMVFPVVMAVFLAMIMTALAGPIARFFQRLLPLWLSVLLSLVLIAGATVSVLALVVNSIAHEGPALARSVTAGIQQVETWLQTGPLHLSDADLNALMQNVQTWAESFGKTLLVDLAGEASAIGTIITAGSVFLFAVVFFMTHPERIWSWVCGWVPRSGRERVDTSGRIAWESISGYTRGIVLVALCDAILVFIGLSILRVPLAPALAALVFLGAFIPVIGAPVATFFAAVVALAERGLLVALLTVALTIVVGSFDGDVLQPLVMGKAVNLHPLAIVTLIAAGAIGFGIVGALFAVPLGGAAYGVLRYLTGRDPEHPKPGAAPPDPPAPAGSSSQPARREVEVAPG